MLFSLFFTIRMMYNTTVYRNEADSLASAASESEDSEEMGGRSINHPPSPTKRLPQVPERVRAMNSSVRLLLIVREPVRRAISDFTQGQSHNMMPSHPAPKTAKPFEDLAISPDGSVNVGYSAIAISLYHVYFHRWLEVFPREQILLVNGDLLIEDPVPQLQRIEKFLGLDHKIGRQSFYFNETKGFYCLQNDATYKCLRETKGRKLPRVDPAVVTKLRKFFIPHNQRFYDLVGEDLGWPED